MEALKIDGACSGTFANLRELCGTGLAHFHAWGSYEMPPNIVTIVMRPQGAAFRVNRLLIPGNAGRWLVHDIKIGNQSQFRSAMPVAGSLIDNALINGAVICPGQDLAVAVEYVGDIADGEEFIGTFICDGADGNRGGRMLLPVRSNVPVRAIDCGRRILLKLDDCVYRFEERRGNFDRVTIADPEELTQICMGYWFADYDVCAIDIAWAAPKDPLLVALRVASFGDGYALFGINEAEGVVVFDLCQQAGAFAAACDLDGYVPTWWSHFEMNTEKLS